MDASIVIVSWNTRDLLRRCLDSVYPVVRELATEIIVVDNGSTDGSVEMVTREFPQIRVIQNHDNRGFAAANNQAVRVSSGRHVLLLNSDAIIGPDDVQRMVHILDGDSRVGIVGAKLLNLDGSFQASYNDFPQLRNELIAFAGLSPLLLTPTFPSYPEAESQELREVDWVGGACMMVRRQMLNQIGLLDDSFFMYSEETDLCYRARRAGWSVVYVPDAVALHGSGSSAQRVPERTRARIYRSKYLYFRKHRGRGVATAFRQAVRIISFVKLLLWLSICLSPNPVARRRGSQNVASYRFLLATV